MSLSDRLRRAFRARLQPPSDKEPPTLEASNSGSGEGRVPPARLGRYRLVRKIGEGGMGIVYAARDDELDRSLAVKVIAPDAADGTSVLRFRREARAAAAVNHPHVCQLYDIGEHEGALYIAMELLEGEPLSERLRRGALAVAESVQVARDILSALGALHSRGLVHRDLKPSNVFLTPHGVKLLDFGLARQSAGLDASSMRGTDLTRSGMIVGTPGYMAPEQIRGQPVDARADLFALGAILFEMLSGRPAFGRGEPVEVLHATLHEQPPALSGSPAAVAVDRIIRSLLQKDPANRPGTAELVVSELAAIAVEEREEARAEALTRIVVLPFRVLRPDPDTDFLSLGLADALSSSLAGLRGVVVRSSASTARFASEQPDLRRIAAEADVDLVILGTLLRAGDRLRASAQLVEAPAGTLLGTHTVEAAVGDLFRLQDDLGARLVESLALPLSGRTQRAGGRRAPRTPLAYELYLRGNHVSRDYNQMAVARDLYRRALEEDPDFAPAWAQLGRAYRLIGKYIEDEEGNRARAEEAFRRALAIDPDLSLAHKLYANFETEWGGGSSSMRRLLERARTRPEDAELFAGLVHACRYCGLLELSSAAHEEARRLDPHVPTSIAYTLYLKGDYERLAREGDSVLDLEPRAIGLVAQGRREEARALLTGLNPTHVPRVFALATASVRTVLEERPDLAVVEKTARAHRDPEALYMVALLFSIAGERIRALEILEQAVRGGYFVSSALRNDPLLEPIRTEPRFGALVELAEAGRLESLRAFEAAGGPEILGL